jgi:hypothetical protein
MMAVRLYLRYGLSYRDAGPRSGPLMSVCTFTKDK